MAYKLTAGLLLLLTTAVSNLNGQSLSVGNNAFEALDGLGCTQFKAIILEAQLQGTYSNALPLTLFVFNDTTYSQITPYRQGTLYDRSGASDAYIGAAEYVNSFTLLEGVQTSAFSDAIPYKTYSALSRKMFLNRRDLRVGNVASGMPGPTRYFCNGAQIIRPNIQAGLHVIHIIDQVLNMPLQYNALAYAAGYNQISLGFQFYKKMMQILQQAPQDDGEYNYNKQVLRPLTGDQVTFFLPSDEAFNQIPSQKLSELQGNLRLMLDIITLHIVPNQVLFTSLVNHNERFNTQFNSGTVVFRKNYNQENMYVAGALSGGKTVTARISTSNVTVINGVVHQIDRVLGLVYRTAIEEIGYDPVTQNFEQWIGKARQDLQNDVKSTNEVTIFVPTNQAIETILDIHPDFLSNQTLLDMVLEMSMLMQGQRVNFMDYNAGYESHVTVVSRYNGRTIKVYSDGTDLISEGGYVQARVVKHDIGVTNGYIHQIDAVFGIPTRDIPATIFCKDWLRSTFVHLQSVGLDKYMRDPTLAKYQACTHSGVPTSGNSVPNNGVYGSNNLNQTDTKTELCGEGKSRCEFTFFVPNGSAIDDFARTPEGRQIMNDPLRWRWLLSRLISNQEKIYIDQIPAGTNKSFVAVNGDEVVVQVDPTSPVNNRTDAYVSYKGLRARILRSDNGATNGVIHIISGILFAQEDLFIDIPTTTSTVTPTQTPTVTPSQSPLVMLQAEVTSLKASVASLEASVASLQATVEALKVQDIGGQNDSKCKKGGVIVYFTLCLLFIFI